MRPITKAGLSLVAILGILQALLVGVLIWPLKPLAAWLVINSQYLRWSLLALTVVVLLTFVVMLLVAILRQATTTQLVVKSDHGRLFLSRQAVANAVAKAVVSNHPVKDIDVDVKMLGRQQATKVAVEAFSLRNTDLAEEGKRIEATVKQKLTEMLGIAAKSVRVTLHPATSTPKKVTRVL